MKFISHTRHYMPNVNLKKTYNIMRLSVVLCMLSLFCASAKTGYSQVAEISLNLHNVTISEALEEIKQQSEYSFGTRMMRLILMRRSLLKWPNKVLTKYYMVFLSNKVYLIRLMISISLFIRAKRIQTWIKKKKDHRRYHRPK